jgi:signal peptidase II
MKKLPFIVTRPRTDHLLPLFSLLFLTIGSDQISKYVARSILTDSGELKFLGGLLRFVLVENYGGFLGIVSNLPDGLRFFFLNVCVAILLITCLVYLLYLSRPKSSFWMPVVFVTGGGISNLLDRIMGNGGVTDFIILGAGLLKTGIFNLADVFILGGSFVLGFQFFRQEKP